MMVFFPPLLSVVKCKRILYEFCFWVFRLSVWMWSLSLLKWFTGSLTLCRNFLLVCRFCFVCLLRRVFLPFLSFSLALIIFLSTGIHFIPTLWLYPYTHTVHAHWLWALTFVCVHCSKKNVASRQHVKYKQAVNTPTHICMWRNTAISNSHAIIYT